MLHNKKTSLISTRNRRDIALLTCALLVIVGLAVYRSQQASGSDILGHVHYVHADKAHAPR